MQEKYDPPHPQPHPPTMNLQQHSAATFLSKDGDAATPQKNNNIHGPIRVGVPGGPLGGALSCWEEQESGSSVVVGLKKEVKSQR